jgi:hypothetical protein
VGLDAEMAAFAAQFVEGLEAQGLPLLDHLTSLPLEENPGDRIAVAKREIDALPAGISHLLFHPAQDSPELRAITPNWRSRVADYEAFSTEEMRRYICDAGVQVIGYRALCDLMRSA